MPSIRFIYFVHLAGATLLAQAMGIFPILQGAQEKPNVLFIAIDDLNDWVGGLDGHPQVKTPNIDRLAKRGVLFTNAHCQAPICQPSRTSLLTGLYPFSNGVYDVEQTMRDAPLVKNAVTLPEYFRKHGYYTLSAGKIAHRTDDEKGFWDEFGGRSGWGWMRERIGPQGVSGLPEPSIFDFGPVPFPKEDMNDMKAAQWAVDRLEEPMNKPFFLAVGLVTPHLPLFTPEAFFDMYPVETTLLPETLPDDLEDLTPMGRKFTRYFDTTPMSHHNITRHGLWRKAVASYLATATFTDYCVGKLIDALDASPYSENTIIVLWSDHGFHLGEKMHWEKRSLWDESTRVPLIVAAPEVKMPGSQSGRAVGLIDLYPTLIELCGLPEKTGLEGRSLAPLLGNPEHEWPYPALTTQMPGNHAVRTENWRYIRYVNGDEELYDHRQDSHEFHNLASNPEYAEIKAQLARHLPKKEVPSGPRLPPRPYTQPFDWTQP